MKYPRGKVANERVSELVSGMSDQELIGLCERNTLVRDMYKNNYLRMKEIVETMDIEIERRGLNG